jgi:hypothetical protein
MSLTLVGKTVLCDLLTCSIVTTVSNVCTTSSVAHFSGTKASGSDTVSYTLDTSQYRASTMFCLSCVSNENAGTVFNSLPFEMKVDCASAGYSVTNHASLVKTVVYTIDGNSPTFPL